LKRIFKVVILICLLAYAPQAHAQNASPKVLESLDTIAGRLDIVWRTDPKNLLLDLIQLNGKTIAKVERASILAYFKGGGDEEFVVLGVSQSNSCGYQKFRVIRLYDTLPPSKSPTVTVSEEFGDCSEDPRISYRNDEVTEIRVDDWAYRYSYGRYQNAKIVHIAPVSRRRSRQ
jgi:hypothetical protein